MSDLYRPGDYYLQCDRCGFKIRRSDARKTWDGLLVCGKDWEPRHPQDYIKVTPDKQYVEEPRSEGADTFLSTNQVSASDL